MSRLVLANERQARHMAHQRPGWRVRSRRLSRFVTIWEITNESESRPYDWADEMAVAS